MSFIYLASPYSASPEVNHSAALRATALFIRAGLIVYSPIVHCHPIHLESASPGSFTFWQRHNFAILAKASDLWVLTLPGWKESTGVRAEIEHANACCIPIAYRSMPEPGFPPFCQNGIR
jgi:hypothetical protein